MTTWASGAHSVPLMAANGVYSFRVPEGVAGVVIGLVLANANPNLLRTGESAYALHFAQGRVTVLAHGSPVAPPVAYTSAQRFHVVRIGGYVYVCQADDVPMDSSAVAAAAFGVGAETMDGAARLDATLRAAGDEVLDGAYADLPGDLVPPVLNLPQGAFISTASDMHVRAVSANVPGGSVRVQGPAPRIRAVQPQGFSQVFVRGPSPALLSVGGNIGVAFDLALPRLTGVPDAQPADDLSSGARAGGEAKQAYVILYSGARAGDGLLLHAAQASLASGAAAGDALALAAQAALESGAAAGDALSVGLVQVTIASGAAAGGDAMGLSATAAAALQSGAAAGDGLHGERAAQAVSGAAAGGMALPGAVAQVSSGARAGDEAAPMPAAMPELMLSSGAAAGDEAVAMTPTLPELRSGAAAGDEVLIARPGSVAWVMNAETGAVSWWGNWQFTDAVQLPDGRVLAVGPEGVSEWTGDADGDTPVQAHVTWGLLEFGGWGQEGQPVASERRKRLTQVTVGYHAALPMRTELHAFGHGQTPHTYAMPPVVAGQAGLHRNHRIVPGKGLSARYWRVQISGQGPYQVHGLTADVAVSARRM
ncbi:MAG: hypothetical protein Q4F13_02845 [Pseudomonadota bacterium]|nr:hypothetical protein [Pseudomonadota bacterium]